MTKQQQLKTARKRTPMGSRYDNAVVQKTDDNIKKIKKHRSFYLKK